jgi:hypothetical protein
MSGEPKNESVRAKAIVGEGRLKIAAIVVLLAKRVRPGAEVLPVS